MTYFDTQKSLEPLYTCHLCCVIFGVTVHVKMWRAAGVSVHRFRQLSGNSLSRRRKSNFCVISCEAQSATNKFNHEREIEGATMANSVETTGVHLRTTLGSIAQGGIRKRSRILKSLFVTEYNEKQMNWQKRARCGGRWRSVASCNRLSLSGARMEKLWNPNENWKKRCQKESCARTGNIRKFWNENDTSEVTENFFDVNEQL